MFRDINSRVVSKDSDKTLGELEITINNNGEGFIELRDQIRLTSRVPKRMMSLDIRFQLSGTVKP